MNYEEAFQESLEHPEVFWGQAAEDIHWGQEMGSSAGSNPGFHL